jgi:hypothetical protein
LQRDIPAAIKVPTSERRGTKWAESKLLVEIGYAGMNRSWIATSDPPT